MPSTLRRLDSLLVERGLAESRSRARDMIERGDVEIPGRIGLKPATLLERGVPLRVRREEIWVSRGAHKLLAALDRFRIDPSGELCLDVGASTGGFTQVLLSRGARRVWAVDVGYGQLAWILRGDPRVEVRERTNARLLRREDFPDPFGGIVCDASFISLRLLLPSLEPLLSERGWMILLFKPQFEVGRERVGKRGVVKDPRVHREALEDFARFVRVSSGLALQDATYSPIRGPEGNIEFPVLLRPNGKTEGSEDDGPPDRSREIDFAALVEAAHRETR